VARRGQHRRDRRAAGGTEDLRSPAVVPPATVLLPGENATLLAGPVSVMVRRALPSLARHSFSVPSQLALATVAPSGETATPMMLLPCALSTNHAPHRRWCGRRPPRGPGASRRLWSEASESEVRIAHSGREALAVFEQFNPGFVLLDIGMPDMDGYEVAREIRRRFADRHPVLIAFTGWGQEADRVRARDAGFDHHLVKPTDFRKLKAIIGGVESVP
jgi:CheY-like chemotaxis protein